MITVKQILEQYNIVSDKATDEEIKLAALSDAGIFESSKIPMIKRSLNKNINEMTEAERKTLKSLLESFMNHVIINENKSMSYPSDKDMPVVIILKRKAIRVFPDNQKIGLYYSQALDRYISIPFGPNVKDLSPQLNEEQIDEISQELATRAYAKRMSKIKDIEDDENTDPAKKAIASKKQKQKLKQLSYRMRTTATDPTGKNIRPWAGTSAVKTAKSAGKLQIAANKKAKDVSNISTSQLTSLRGISDKDLQSRYMIASPEERNHMRRNLGYKPPNLDIISKSGSPGLAAAAVIGAGIGDFFRKTPKMPIKESFKNNLHMIREEKQIDEVSWQDIKSGAKTVGDFVAPGIMNVGRSIKKGEVPSLSDVGSAALDVGTAVAGATTLGLGAAAIRGGRAALQAYKYAKKGQKLSAAGKAAKKGFTRSRGWRFAKGALKLGGAAAASLSDIGNLTKPTDAKYEFGNIKPQLNTAGERSNVDPSKAKGWAQAGVSGVTQNPVYSESNNLNTFKQIVENNIPSHTIQIGEETITINKSIAKRIIKLHESLNRSNKQKLERMLNEDITSLTKVINFAIKQ